MQLTLHEYVLNKYMSALSMILKMGIQEIEFTATGYAGRTVCFHGVDTKTQPVCMQSRNEQ